MTAGKKILIISLATNASLIAWLVLKADPDVKTGFGSLDPSAQTPFTWSDLRSGDYAAYIGNLTKMACPQKTIRAIVETELEEAFALRRAPFVEKLAQSTTTDSERNVAKLGLQQLDLEKERILEQLFGAQPPREESEPQRMVSAQAADTKRVATQVAAPDLAPTMPLVFRSVDTNQFNLSGDELAVIERVRGEFLNQLGTNEDVTSPEYLQRWQKGQNEADNLVGTLLGRQAWLQYQEAAQQSEAASK